MVFSEFRVARSLFSLFVFFLLFIMFYFIFSLSYDLQLSLWNLQIFLSGLSSL